MVRFQLNARSPLYYSVVWAVILVAGVALLLVTAELQTWVREKYATHAYPRAFTSSGNFPRHRAGRSSAQCSVDTSPTPAPRKAQRREQLQVTSRNVSQPTESGRVTKWSLNRRIGKTNHIFDRTKVLISNISAHGRRDRRRLMSGTA